MTRMIDMRTYWGSFGSVLLHGIASHEFEDLSDSSLPSEAIAPGTVFYSVVACSPLISFPMHEYLICMPKARELFESEFDAQFLPVYLVDKIHVPWRKWLRTGEFHACRNGDPYSYFDQSDSVDGFEAGYAAEYSALHVDQEVLAYRKSKSSLDGEVPIIIGRAPDSHFFWGVDQSTKKRICLYCSEFAYHKIISFSEVLDFYPVAEK